MSVLALLLFATLNNSQARSGTAQPPKPMPPVLREATLGTDRVLFVSARQALGPDGAIREELFPAETGIMLRRLLERPPVAGCIPDGEHHYDRVNVPVRDSLDVAISTAATIIEGVVDGREYGFHGGEPGQLLRLADLEILHGNPSRAEHLFIFLPVGRFSVGPHQICKTDARYASEPAMGDRVVVLLLPHMAGSEFLEVLDESGLITVRADEALSLPSRFESADVPRTRNALRQRIDERVRVKVRE
jgi:hypothetical protein